MESDSGILSSITKAMTALLCTLLLVGGCEGSSDGSERQMMQTIDSFAVNYFNWQYHRALSFCTPESKPWLSFAASQVTQEDIDLLHQEAPASYEVQSVENINDTTVLANITVYDFLQPDSIGKQPHHVSKADFCLRMVLPTSEKRWKVDVTQLPRPKKRQAN